jgi:IS66 C-terminal element
LGLHRLADRDLQIEWRRVEPQAYFADVLTRLVNLWPASRLDELMPWAWGLRNRPKNSPPEAPTPRQRRKIKPSPPWGRFQTI